VRAREPARPLYKNSDRAPQPGASRPVAISDGGSPPRRCIAHPLLFGPGCAPRMPGPSSTSWAANRAAPIIGAKMQAEGARDAA
jgi:hypothetical protein